MTDEIAHPCKQCGVEIESPFALYCDRCRTTMTDELRPAINFTAAAVWADARMGDPEELGNKYWDIWNVARAYDALYSRVGVCTWTEDADGNWDTECGETFVFSEGGPGENGQRFCGYCGKFLSAVAFKFEEDEDE